MGGMEAELTHLDAAGTARMVDVSAKGATERYARARAVVRMSPESAARVQRGDNPKGDVAAVARIAAIQAAKRTDELIPLAHSLPLTHVDPEIAIDAEAGTVTIVAEARCADRTGVEMEAMVACSVAALTVYDMVKGIEAGRRHRARRAARQDRREGGLPPRMRTTLREPLADGHGRADRRRPDLGHRPLQLPLPVLHARRGPAVAQARRAAQLRGDHAARADPQRDGRPRRPPDRRRAAGAQGAVQAGRVADRRCRASTTCRSPPTATCSPRRSATSSPPACGA